jgi:hypothetical protein
MGFWILPLVFFGKKEADADAEPYQMISFVN